MKGKQKSYPFDFDKPKKEESGESMKDGLSCKKPLRGQYEGLPARENSTDYYKLSTPEVE